MSQIDVVNEKWPIETKSEIVKQIATLSFKTFNSYHYNWELFYIFI